MTVSSLIQWIRGKMRRRFPMLLLFWLAGSFCMLIIVESGCNFWVRAAFCRSLIKDSPGGRVVIRQFDWLTLADLASGRMGTVKAVCYNCIQSDLAFERMDLATEGFVCNLLTLLRQKKFSFRTMARTRIDAQINAAAVSDYLVAHYTRFQPKVRFFAGRFCVVARMTVWGRQVPVELYGALQAHPPKIIRLKPQTLRISGHEVPKEFLQLVNNQFPLEIGVLEDWPLQLNEIRLETGKLYISMREMGRS